MRRRRAAATAGAITYPPIPSTTSGRKRSTIRSAARRAVGMRYGRARFFQGASRSSPRTRTVSSSNPAAGTRRSAGPPARPTSRPAPPGSSTRNARATASAGYRCPPVPPPAIKSLITASIVSQCRTRAVAGDAEQDPHGRESGRQGGAAVAEERKRHARDRQGVGDRGHVQQRLEGDPGRDRGRESHAEAIRGPQRRPVAAHSENQESEHHQRRADEAGLLADDGEDEVGVRLRQPPVLLDRVPDADAEEPARRQSIERLGRLKTCPERVRPWIPERGQAPHSVRLEERDRKEGEAQPGGEQHDVPQPAARRPVRADEDADDDDRRSDVALEHEQDQHAGEHGHEWNEYVLEVAHAMRVPVDPVGDEDGEGELAQLRGLERAERPGVEPAPGSVHAHPQVRHEDEEHEQRGRGRAGRSQRAKAAVVEAAQHEERHESHQHPGRLALRVVEGGLVLRVGEGDARARDHHQAGRAQGDGGEKQQPVRLLALCSCGAHAANRRRTRSLNWLPRSSKSLNMSKLLYAGLRRTTLPLRARPAAMDTASSSAWARITLGWDFSASASSSADAPMRITASVLASTSATQSPSSNPPPYPPAIRITGAPGNALSATRPASGFVAFESLYQRAPAHSPTSSSRCSTPLKERMAALIASSLRPAMRPTAAAASAFSMLCRPGSGIGGCGWWRSNHTTCPWAREASCFTIGSRPLRTAKSEWSIARAFRST